MSILRNRLRLAIQHQTHPSEIWSPYRFINDTEDWKKVFPSNVTGLPADWLQSSTCFYETIPLRHGMHALLGEWGCRFGEGDLSSTKESTAEQLDRNYTLTVAVGDTPPEPGKQYHPTQIAASISWANARDSREEFELHKVSLTADTLILKTFERMDYVLEITRIATRLNRSS